MREQDLWAQGDFVIYRRGGEQLDTPYEALGPFPEGKLVGRQRARAVEIDFALGEVDAARITFVDPERVLAGYLAEEAKSPSYLTNPWTVGIGYHFAPPSQWVWFTGIPMLEGVTYPPDRPPEVTIVLLDASVLLARTRSPELGALSRHWLFVDRGEPPSLQRALQEMANFYGLELDLGSIGPVIQDVDQMMKEYFEDPVGFMEKEYTAGPTFEDSPLLAHLPKAAAERAGVLRSLMNFSRKDMTDQDYLKHLAVALQPYVDKLFEGEATGGVNDALWTKVRHAGNILVYGIRENKLYFQRLRDFIGARIDFISVFSYQMDDCSLLEFTPRIVNEGQGTQIQALITSLFARRSGKNETVQVEIPSTSVLLGGAYAQMREDKPVEDPEEADPLKLNTTQRFRYILAPYTRRYQDAPIQEVLGFLCTNLEAEATVLGAPWLRAGMLVGTRGLGPGPENKPNPGQPQRVSTYDRVWLVRRCTHSVDETGRYLTRLELAGASSDDSKGKPEKIFQDLVSKVAEGQFGTRAWYEFLLEIGQRIVP